MVLIVKTLPASAGDIRDVGFDSWVGKISWRRKWILTSVFLPGEPHGQRSPVGYSPWGCKKLEQTCPPTLPIPNPTGLQTVLYFISCSVAQLSLTLCDSMDHSPPGSSVHGVLQARILEWVAYPFSRGSSQPRDQTWVSRIAGGCFNL